MNILYRIMIIASIFSHYVCYGSQVPATESPSKKPEHGICPPGLAPWSPRHRITRELVGWAEFIRQEQQAIDNSTTTASPTTMPLAPTKTEEKK